MKEISHFPIGLPLSRIQRRLKVPASADFSKYEHLIDRFFTLVEPRCRFDDLAISLKPGKILFSNGYEMVSESLRTHLQDCSRVSLIGVTIGPHIEEEMESYQKQSKILEPLILDAVGSECVEEAAIYISNLIGDQIRKHRRVPTKRFSPGYGDLSLEVQNYFFKRLKLNEIGLELNASLLMVPQKSITAFIGWKGA
jgi:hypothetical protein